MRHVVTKRGAKLGVGVGELACRHRSERLRSAADRPHDRERPRAVFRLLVDDLDRRFSLRSLDVSAERLEVLPLPADGL
jgi:hypothetical protein